MNLANHLAHFTCLSIKFGEHSVITNKNENQSYENKIQFV